MNLSAELDRWLSPGARDLLVRIGSCAAAMGHGAFLVGGPVRDLLLGRTSLDLDVVVEGDAPAVACAATMPGEPAPVIHPAFGTATICSGVFRVDLASARAESYERPGALPLVRPGTIEQDLVRRDFTVNAMALTLDGRRRGELLDPYGGLADLEHGLLRVLHDDSFVDDATRILRGVRYEQRFGFAFEGHTMALLQRGLPHLDLISADRVRHELERTFSEEEPELSLRRLDALGVLAAIHPALGFREQKAWALMRARRGSLSFAQVQSAFWCLLAWGMTADDAERLSTRLNLPRRVREPVAEAVRLSLLEPRLDRAGLSPGEVFDMLHGFSHAAVATAELLFARPAARANVFLYSDRLRHVRPSLTGKDLRALGIPEGPQLGRILSSLRTARLNGAVSSREEELALAQVLSGADC